MDTRTLATATPPLRPRFVVNGDGTVTDHLVGVMWSRATLTDEPVYSVVAENLCTDLRLGGYADWRLPELQELAALVDYTTAEPAIDILAFPDTKNYWYWTRTSAVWTARSTWVVSFGWGMVVVVSPDFPTRVLVRAVRTLPANP